MKILEIFGNIWSVMIEIMYAVDMAYNLCKWGKWYALMNFKNNSRIDDS